MCPELCTQCVSQSSPLLLSPSRAEVPLSHGPGKKSTKKQNKDLNIDKEALYFKGFLSFFPMFLDVSFFNFVSHNM